jgi:signal transduction histidine kinase
VLRNAQLASAEWITLLPELSPSARAILRHRRDLGSEVQRALESFGRVDFVLGERVVSAPAEAEIVLPDIVPVAPEPNPFVAVGAIARDLSVVAEALRRGAPPANDTGAVPTGKTELFEISDVVARIEAFRKRQDDAAPRAFVPLKPDTKLLQFETDALGIVRWVEGVPRGSFIGTTLARAALPGGSGVDGVAAGAYRQRARFTDARLMMAGVSDAAGLWLVSGVPAFDAASGRFTGYRGTGRRPRADEAPRSTAPSADSLRQLVHELRTPTNAIAGFAEMIEHQMLGPVADPYRAQATTIRTHARGLLSAIDDLDIAARIEAGALQQHRETVALAPLLDEVVADLTPLAEMRGAALVLSASGAAVFADKRAVERLLGRLLATLVSAASTGERIGVDVLARAEGMATIIVDRPAALADQPGDALYAIDEEGGQGALLGTGFALRLVRNLARELGGGLTIGADSLTLRLPAAVDHVVEQVHLN